MQIDSYSKQGSFLSGCLSPEVLFRAVDSEPRYLPGERIAIPVRFVWHFEGRGSEKGTQHGRSVSDGGFIDSDRIVIRLEIPAAI